MNVSNSWSRKTLLRTICATALVLSTFIVALPAVAFTGFSTVTFAENATSSDPMSQVQTENAPTPLTPFADFNPPLLDPGYTFIGWNSSANGTGTSFSDGSVYSFGADVELYAQWSLIPVTDTVTFIENDSTSDSVFAYLAESQPSPLTTFANLQPAFVDSGHYFIGWNTAPNGSGTSYSDGSIYPFSADIQLYAQWTLTNAFHTVSFKENDGVSDEVTSTLVEDIPSSLTSFANLEPSFTNTGHEFLNWNTMADGDGVSYGNGDMFSFANDLTLFAQWSQETSDTFSFNANGGSGSVMAMSGPPGASIILPGQGGLIRSGFTLTSWDSSPNGAGTSFAIGQVVMLTGSATLYAQWKGHQPATLVGAVGTFHKNSSSLSVALKSQIERLAFNVKEKRFITVKLYGYTASTGLASLNMSLSRERAAHVANYLRGRLKDLGVKGVSISSAGEGSIAGEAGSEYSRVEVFGS